MRETHKQVQQDATGLKQPYFQTEELLDATGGTLLGAGAPAIRCAGVVTDSRTSPEQLAGSLFVALEGERFDGHAFLKEAQACGAAAAIVRADHPCARAGLPLPCVAVENTQRSLGDLAAYHRRRHEAVPLVAITGSNGKTTTRSLIQGALEASLGTGLATTGNFNNLIGVPLTLFGLRAEHAYAAIEMGMSAPGEIARLCAIARPQLGVITNAAPVHLEGLGSVEGVADAKAELWQGLEPGSTLIVNADDALLLERAQRIAREGQHRLLSFGVAEDSDLRLLEVVLEGQVGLRVRFGGPALGSLAREVSLGLLGLHNGHNAAAALLCALALGADPDRALEGLSAVRATGRRLRASASVEGALLLDDCYNANLVSMQAALRTAAALRQSRGGQLCAALGDMLELGAEEEAMHEALGSFAAEAGVSKLLAFGPRAAAIARAAERLAPPPKEILHTEDPGEAIRFLQSGCQAQDVLLIKGSRGMQMERIVQGLEAKPEALAQ